MSRRDRVATHKKALEEAIQPPAVREKGPKLITSKEMILQQYPDVFEGIGQFPGTRLPYTA